MLVGKWMTPDPLTIQVSEPVTEAVLLMKDRGIRHLPVMDGDKLAGIVSDRDLKEFTPSRATTLDIYELHYLLAKTRVAEVMRKEPFRVSPEDTIEKAALLMHDRKIGSLPVVDQKGKLVGLL
ncbi:MAG: CBS domain-containing protein, partial [Deltaproteobacteria bacterium]|nr:CBS domain-containing protein [Deltaproteobacteria bacterium]